MKRKLYLRILGTVDLAFLMFVMQAGISGPTKTDGAIALTNQIAGLGSISGTVKASKGFKAAKVYARNVDKNVVYMVYSEKGRYRAVNLFPGNYEVSVVKNGFSGGDMQKVTVAAGAIASADFTLRDGIYRPEQQTRCIPRGCDDGNEILGIPPDEPLVSYDRLYPPGPGRETAEKTCMRCHGPDFLPNRHWDADQWNAAIDLMESTALNSNPPGRIGPASIPGGLAPRSVRLLCNIWSRILDRTALLAD